MIIKINYKGKEIGINVNKLSKFGHYIGLMFRTRETSNLLFDFEKNTQILLHSYFVFFPFLVLWLDEHNRVMDFCIVNPFSLHINPKKKFRKIVEIPINKRNVKIARFFVGEERFKYNSIFNILAMILS